MHSRVTCVCECERICVCGRYNILCVVIGLKWTYFHSPRTHRLSMMLGFVQLSAMFGSVCSMNRYVCTCRCLSVFLSVCRCCCCCYYFIFFIQLGVFVSFKSNILINHKWICFSIDWTWYVCAAQIENNTHTAIVEWKRNKRKIINQIAKYWNGNFN